MPRHLNLDTRLQLFLHHHARDEATYNCMMLEIQMGYLRTLQRLRLSFDGGVQAASWCFTPAIIDQQDEWWNPSGRPGYHLVFVLATGDEFGFTLSLDHDCKIDSIWHKDYWQTRAWLKEQARFRVPFIRDVLI
jgi:hypothetical protein